MTEIIKRHQAVGLVPFYADRELTSNQFAVLATQTLHSIGYLGLKHQVFIIDDGGTLRGDINLQDVVATIRLDSHGGKAAAVRRGINEVLQRHPQTEYLIQADFDGDPNPQQANQMLRLLRRNGITGDQPAMVLGERDEALRKRGNFNEHRRKIFALQQRFCSGLGFPDIIDLTTGLRVYTRSLAERFVEDGKADAFGSDVEQLVLARLANAIVIPHKLKHARKRLDHTILAKFKDCQDALSLHEQELVKIGLGGLVEIFGKNNPLVDALKKFQLYNSGDVVIG